MIWSHGRRHRPKLMRQRLTHYLIEKQDFERADPGIGLGKVDPEFLLAGRNEFAKSFIANAHA